MYRLGSVKYRLDFTKAKNENRYLTDILLFKIYR